MQTLSRIRSVRFSAVRLAARGALAGYAAFSAMNARAADLSAVALAFGNTVISTYPDGRTQKIWLHPDGSWDGLSRAGRPTAGRWTLKGHKVCMRQSRPPTLPISVCTPFPEHAEVGVQWDSHDVMGRPIRLTLEKGAPDSPPNYADAVAGGQASASSTPAGALSSPVSR
jgi:hypothetical protein